MKLIDCRKPRNEKEIAMGWPFLSTRPIWEPDTEAPAMMRATGTVVTMGIGPYRAELSAHEALEVAQKLIEQVLTIRKDHR